MAYSRNAFEQCVRHYLEGSFHANFPGARVLPSGEAGSEMSRFARKMPHREDKMVGEVESIGAQPYKSNKRRWQCGASKSIRRLAQSSLSKSNFGISIRYWRCSGALCSATYINANPHGPVWRHWLVTWDAADVSV